MPVAHFNDADTGRLVSLHRLALTGKYNEFAALIQEIIASIFWIHCAIQKQNFASE